MSSAYAEELAHIRSQARSLGLDPNAVLAVAAHEGVTIPAQVGDQGTSFGPWQLHAGGRLPASVWARGPAYARQWADSPAGIDYALGGIASVAKGLTGNDAIDAIVRRFEQPRADLAPGEISRSQQTYASGGVPVASGASLGITPSTTTGAPTPYTSTYAVTPFGQATQAALLPVEVGLGTVDAGKKLVGGISSVEDALKFLFSYRFLEILGGGVLIIVGVVGLMREVGIRAPALPGAVPPDLVRKAARAPRPERPLDAGSDSDRRVPQTTSYGKRQATGDDIPF